jgi:hypothetical protein
MGIGFTHEQKRQERWERELRLAERVRNRQSWINKKAREREERKKRKREGKEREPGSKNSWGREWDWVKFLLC